MWQGTTCQDGDPPQPPITRMCTCMQINERSCHFSPQRLICAFSGHLLMNEQQTVGRAEHVQTDPTSPCSNPIPSSPALLSPNGHLSIFLLLLQIQPLKFWTSEQEQLTNSAVAVKPRARSFYTYCQTHAYSELHTYNSDTHTQKKSDLHLSSLLTAVAGLIIQKLK